MVHKHFLTKFVEKMDNNVNIQWFNWPICNKEIHKWPTYNKKGLNDYFVINIKLKDHGRDMT